MKKLVKEIIQWSVTILGAMAIALFFRSYAFAVTEIRQCSMETTLFEGQRVIEYKLGYIFSEPERGDIVVFDRDENNKELINRFVSECRDFYRFVRNRPDEDHLIKRVIGLPGDTIDIKDRKVIVNGRELEEPYSKGITLENQMELPLKVPENKLFVMGDNREFSMDSRAFGAIDLSNIEGKAVLRVWPIDKAGRIE